MPVTSPRLVGRDGELEALEELARALMVGDGGSCVVAGPAGIGKTALLSNFLTRAERGGARVLRARGFELEGTLSFGAVRDLLGPPVLRLPAPGARPLAPRARGLGEARARPWPRGGR